MSPHPHCICSTPIFYFTFFFKGGRGGCKFSPHPRTWRNREHRAAGYSQKTVNFMLNSLLPILCLSVVQSVCLSVSLLLALSQSPLSPSESAFLFASVVGKSFSLLTRAHTHIVQSKKIWGAFVELAQRVCPVAGWMLCGWVLCVCVCVCVCLRVCPSHLMILPLAPCPCHFILPSFFL